MVMLKIAICGDENIEVEEIGNILSIYCKQNKIPYVLKKYNSGSKLTESSLLFDIIFLDLMMELYSGIDVAKKIRTWNYVAKIVYITDSGKFQGDIFEVHAFDYVQKPVTEKKVFYVLDEIVKYMDNHQKYPVCSLQTNEKIVKLRAEDIYYFEYSARKIKIVTRTEEYYSTAYTLKELIKKFEQYGFLSPHKSFIVNLFHIKSIKGCEIIMDDASDTIIPLSQKRAACFKKQFNEYLHKTFDKI